MTLMTVYRSPNGDDWLIDLDETGGAASVVHRPNASSGGRESTMPADEFLERGGRGPEHEAVRAALSALRADRSGQRS